MFLILFIFIRTKTDNKMNKFFYEVDEINKDLYKINPNKYEILSETIKLNNDINKNDWNDWPETELYEKNGTWKIFPFFAFNTWVYKNCERCPNIYKFIKKIKGLKLATLSKLSPGMKLKPHKGWGSHSNHVIRCHYGIIVPKNCFISVEENNKVEITLHKQFEWLIFDDSKTHYEEKKSDSDRIILIVDIERPSNIKTGESDVGDSKELLDIVDYFKKNNIKKNVSDDL